MYPPSLTLRTEMLFWRAEGEVLDRGDYWLVRTPCNPTYYGGNLLAFRRPPAEGDYRRWTESFAREFKDQPAVRHVLFVWDVPPDAEESVGRFLADGFEMKSNVTLTARAVHPPPKLNGEVEVRRIETDAEWEAVLAAKVADRDRRFGRETFTSFKRRWLNVRRRLAAAERGGWYGAFLGGRLVGDLGLFRDGAVARFQDVGTARAFRRRGICGTLVYEVSKSALETHGVEMLVMVADEGYHAAQLYESVGFERKERHASVCRHPEKTKTV